MFNDRRVIAIIPARGGSKGPPGKIIRLLKGKPLIAHSILQALEAGIFDEIFVSTDSSEYLTSPAKIFERRFERRIGYADMNDTLDTGFPCCVKK